jgi:radical SAM superfamily enzyme YgiQ (UPF0313 family)
MNRVVLISAYELGRQPFGLASPAAWLRDSGAQVVLLDLAVSEFDDKSIQDALLVAIYVPMHTATRMAESIIARTRESRPDVHICAYGLYAPMNADHLFALGVDTIVGGEFEEPLVGLYRELAATPVRNDSRRPQRSIVSLGRQQFLVPERSGLPGLDQYAALRLGEGTIRTVGYTEASRGCKHLCRHCPIVPVYGGRFRVVQVDPVLGDIRQQVSAGAEHITFGDPDFFNAPAHSRKIINLLHDEFPELSYDVTIKVEHLRKHSDLIPTLKQTGCVLITSAFESLDNDILRRLGKNHTIDDADHVTMLMRAQGITLNPTFVSFTPWTTLAGYANFLRSVLQAQLVDMISPVQYSIRLLIPSGSRLRELDEIKTLTRDFEPRALAYPWSNPDPAVDELHRDIAEVVKTGQRAGHDRRDIFDHIWRTTHSYLGTAAGPGPDLTRLPPVAAIPQLTEPWYCCAEPTDEQIARL